MILHIDNNASGGIPAVQVAHALSHTEFEDHFATLLFTEHFLGFMSMNMQRVPDEKCKTAYVKINQQGTIVMGYNPFWMNSLLVKKRIGVIKHEIFHLVFWHLTSRRPRGKYMKEWNYGADAAANSIIGADELPDGCIIPGRMLGPKADAKLSQFVHDLPVLQSAEYYFNEFKKFRETQEKENPENTEYEYDFGSGEGSSTLDDHDVWDVPEEIENEIREKLKKTIEEMVKAAAAAPRYWGSIPESIRRVIISSLNKTIPWDKILQSFLGRARSRQETTSIKVINKRYPYIHPGFKKKTRSIVWIFGDQSKSVSDGELSLFFGTLESLSKLIDEFVYYPFDVRVHDENKIIWKSAMRVAKNRVADGGTDFDAVADYVNRRRGQCDAVIILTDGYAPLMKPIYGVDVLWVITTNGTTDAIPRGQRFVKMAMPNVVQRQ